MNENIKELALKSMDSYPSFDNVALGQYSNSQYNSAIEQMMTTFAELIVKECCHVMSEHDQFYGEVMMSPVLKEHFGVE